VFSCGEPCVNTFCTDWRHFLPFLPFSVMESACANCECCARLNERCNQLEARLRALEAGQRRPRGVRQRPPSVPPSGKWTVTDATPNLGQYFEYRNSDFEKGRGRCRLTVVRGDLVSAAEDYKVHVVSSDMRRSKGVAVQFAAAYGPVDMEANSFEVGDVFVQAGTDGTHLVNLVHKKRYFHRFAQAPERFLGNLVKALESLKIFCVQKQLKRIALVRVASQTDRVHWRWTQRKLLDVFADLDIELAVYLQARRKFGRTPGTPQVEPLFAEGSFPPLRTPRTTSLLEKVACNLTGLQGEKELGACSSPVLASRPEAPGLPALPTIASAVVGAPLRSPSPKTGTISSFKNPGPAGGGSLSLVNATHTTPRSVEELKLPVGVPVDVPVVLADLEGRGAFLTDPRGEQVGPPLTTVRPQVRLFLFLLLVLLVLEWQILRLFSRDCPILPPGV
jgi:hypothetical protein